MLAPPTEVYSTDLLPDLRELFCGRPELLDATSEAIAERLCCEAWIVEAALETLTVDGEVLP